MNIQSELKALNDDLVSAYYELEEHSIIFRESEKRIELLNKIAPTFFSKVNFFYWRSFIMTISRFTDPSDQNKNKNLSLRSLLKYQPELKQEDQEAFKYCLDKIETQIKHIRKFRSKYISHKDYNYAILSKNDIDPIEIKKVEDIYSLFSDCLNIFNRHYVSKTILFRGMRTSHGARSLIYHLKEGVIYNEFKTRRKDFVKNEEEINLSEFKDA
jgi:AbiU2